MEIINKIKVLKNSGFAQKVLNGTFWMTIGSVFSKILLALAYILLARILPANEYGEYGMLKSTIDNFLIFASLGVGLTTTKYISENKNINPDLASGILGTSLMLVFVLGMIVAVGIFAFSDIIAIKMLDSVTLKPLLGFVAIILIFTSLNGVQLGTLLGLQSFKQTSIANILQGVFLFLGLTIGGYLGGVKGAIIGNLIAIISLFITLQIILRKELIIYGIRTTLKNWKSNFKTIYKFAIPASLSTLITAPTIWILNTMLVKTPDGYTQLGIYSAVIVFTNAIQMLNGTLSNVLLPIFLSNETEITPKKEFFNYFSSWIIAILIGIPFLVFPEIVGIIIGSKYDPETVVKVVGFALISTLIIANKQGISRDLIIKNKMWLSVFSMGQWALTTLLLFYYLKGYGAVGFSASFAIGYAINLVIFVPYFIKTKISPSYLFFNKWVLGIWLVLVSLIFINVYKMYPVRIFSIILIVLLFYSFNKLAKDIVVRN